MRLIAASEAETCPDVGEPVSILAYHKSAVRCDAVSPVERMATRKDTDLEARPSYLPSVDVQDLLVLKTSVGRRVYIGSSLWFRYDSFETQNLF